MAKRDGAAVGVDLLAVVRKTEGARHRQHLRGKGFIELNEINVVDGEADLAEQPLYCRNGPDAHIAWLNSGCGRGENTRFWSESKFHGSFFSSHQQGAGTVVDARGIASRDAAILTKGC